MRTQSTVELPSHEVVGENLRIHFNCKVVDHYLINGETDKHYLYETAIVKLNAPRDEIIESVIGVRYRTYGAEIAAIQKNCPDHAKHRELAKRLADEWLSVSS
jgi:hypothetical protein